MLSKVRSGIPRIPIFLAALLILAAIGFAACNAEAAAPKPSDVTIRVTGYLTQIDQSKSFPPERQAEIEIHALQFPAGSDPNYAQWSAALDQKYPVVYEQVPGLYFIGDITVAANGVPTTTEISGATPHDYFLPGASNSRVSCTVHNTDFPDGNLPEYLQVDILKEGKIVATGNTSTIFTGLTVSTP